MPLLNCQFLKSYRQRRLAHLVLSFISTGYVWQEGEREPEEVMTRRLPVKSSGRPAAPGMHLLGTVLFAWKMGPFLCCSLGMS